MRNVQRTFWLFALVSMASLGPPPNKTSAGDRELAIMFVNMTPDAASTEASKTCISAIRSELKAGYTTITAKGESWIRARHEDGKVQDFMRWAKTGDGVRDKLGFVDALMLIDCQPEKGKVRAWVAPANDRVGRLTLSRKPSDADLKFFTKMLLAHGWIGFVP